MEPAVATHAPATPRAITASRLLFAASLPCAGIAICAPFAAWGWFPDLCLHLSCTAALTLLPGLIAVRRQPFRCGFLLSAMVLGLWPWLGAAHTPRAPLPDTAGMRFVTANIYDFNEQRPQALAALIALDADLLAVQEVWPGDEAVLAEHWPYRIWHRDRGLFASALLSRLPLRDTRIHDLEGYALIETVAQTDTGPLRVFVVHLASPKRQERAALRGRQMARLTNLIDASSGPLLIAGDFNLSAASPSWRDLCAETALLRPAGPGPATWPRWLGPFGIDLDHVAGRGVAFAPLELVAIPGSDHLGLRTRVALLKATGDAPASDDQTKRRK